MPWVLPNPVRELNEDSKAQMLRDLSKVTQAVQMSFLDPLFLPGTLGFHCGLS